MNDNCEEVVSLYTLYSVPKAAALWCGVPEDEVDYILSCAEPVGDTARGKVILRHPQIKCLEPRIRAILAAIDKGQLPTYNEAGKTGVDGYVGYSRRHVLGRELKEWSKHLREEERPSFLFEEATTPNRQNPDPTLSTRSRRTHQAIIAALCKKAGIDWEERGAAQEIIEALELIGQTADGNTIRRILKEVPDSLEARQK